MTVEDTGPPYLIHAEVDFGAVPSCFSLIRDVAWALQVYPDVSRADDVVTPSRLCVV